MEATVPPIWELDLELLTVWTMTMTHQILQIPPGEITFEFFLVFPPLFPTFFQYFFLFSRSQNNDKDRRGSSGSRQSPTVSGHNMNNDSDRDRNNRGPGGRDHGQNKVLNYLRLKTV